MVKDLKAKASNLKSCGLETACGHVQYTHHKRGYEASRPKNGNMLDVILLVLKDLRISGEACDYRVTVANSVPTLAGTAVDIQSIMPDGLYLGEARSEAINMVLIHRHAQNTGTTGFRHWKLVLDV